MLNTAVNLEYRYIHITSLSLLIKGLTLSGEQLPCQITQCDIYFQILYTISILYELINSEFLNLMTSGKVSREGADNEVVKMRSYIFQGVNVVDSIIGIKTG
jgi:hypothetical protein